MSDKEKSRFHKMAEEDKQRCDTEMHDLVRGKKRKHMEVPNSPKRALKHFTPINTMDISQLPELVVEKIAHYMDFKDVCSCSQVSRSWREAFDFDRIWKRFLKYHSKYFDRQRSKLNYTIDVDFNKVCKAKETIFEELFVQRNMMRGNFHIAEVDLGSVSCESIVDGVDSEGNHWMFLSCADRSKSECNHEIQVWSLKDKPNLHTRVTTQRSSSRLLRIHNLEMKLNNDKLFYLYKDTVLIYEFAPPSHQLVFLHKILFTPLATFPQDVYIAMRLTHINNWVVGFLYSSLHINHSAPPFFHVWDQDGSLVYHEYSFSINPREYQENQLDISIDSSSFPCIDVQSNGIDLVAVVYQFVADDSDFSLFVVRIFSTITFKYVDFVYKKRGDFVSMVILKSVLSVIYGSCEDDHAGEHAIVYGDTGLARKLHKIWLEYPVFHGLVQGREGIQLVILESSDVFSVFNATNGEKLNQFKVSHFDVNFNLHVYEGKKVGVKVIKTNLMLLNVVKGGKVTQEVWNCEKGQKLYTLNYNAHIHKCCESFVMSCNSQPKLVAYNRKYDDSHGQRNNKLFITSFW